MFLLLLNVTGRKTDESPMTPYYLRVPEGIARMFRALSKGGAAFFHQLSSTPQTLHFHPFHAIRSWGVNYAWINGLSLIKTIRIIPIIPAQGSPTQAT